MLFTDFALESEVKVDDVILDALTLIPQHPPPSVLWQLCDNIIPTIRQVAFGSGVRSRRQVGLFVCVVILLLQRIICMVLSQDFYSACIDCDNGLI